MTSFKNVRRYATVALTGLMLACGSSGDSSLALTAANAQTIAAQSMNSTDMLESMAEIFDEFDEVIETQNALQVLCTDGNFTQNINDAAPLNEVSTGDSVSFVFNACTMEDDGFSVTLNGGVSLTVDEATGEEGSAFVRRLVFSFDALTVDLGGVSIAVDGGFTIEASSTDGSDLRAMIMGQMFSAYARVGGRAESMRLYDFNMNRMVDAEDGFTFSYDAKINSSQNGGTVTFETMLPFSGTGEGNPSEGQLRITGDGGGVVTLSAVDSVDVEILVDVEGDDEVDATIYTTWDFLDNEG